jgi:hypothetical protein
MFKLKFKPNRSVSKTFIDCFGKTPVLQQKVMEKAKSSIAKYWMTNIYKFFDARISLGLRNTGQLGRSLRIDIDLNSIKMRMVELHNERTTFTFFRPMTMKMFAGGMNFQPFSMPSLGIGQTINTDYGRLLREGVAPSVNGRYNPDKDCKNRSGYHPGYDPKTRWDPWMNDFGRAAKNILASHMLKALSKMGIKPKSTKWRVDIVI